jgi:hypothetical protein
MNYVDFVDRVLTAIDETAAAMTNEYASLVSVMEVGKRIVGEADVDPTMFHGSPLHRGINAAVDDLVAMGLADESASLFVKLTPNGRQLVGKGLRSQWPGLVEALPLTDDAHRFLSALCDVTEQDHEAFAELYVADSDEVLTALGDPWSGGKVIEIWNELDQRLTVHGVPIIGGKVRHARPTYVGFVLARVGPAAQLMQLVKELVEDWEGATVDHKVRLELGSDRQKAELAKDVAALANTQARGRRFLVVGFDDPSRSFVESFDTSVDQDRIDDILNTRLSAVPEIRVNPVAWPGGTAGLMEVSREPVKLPYMITRDLTEKIREGDVFVRRGSHVAKADTYELADLIAERDRAIGSVPPQTSDDPS